MRRLATYLSFVRFSHSVFALPFALTGALLAWRHHPFSWAQVAWIVVCMVGARSAAMGFNRLADARFDALNPRTSMRELPRGAMTPREAALWNALRLTYFKPAPSQALAAERLDVPFSTYRRHLVRGVAHVVETLWRQETAG